MTTVGSSFAFASDSPSAGLADTPPTIAAASATGSRDQGSDSHLARLFRTVVVVAVLVLLAGITGLVLTRSGRDAGSHR